MVVALDFSFGLLLPTLLLLPAPALYFPTDTVLPLLAPTYCNPQLWLHILDGSRLPTPARMPPTNHMPSQLQTAYALSNNQISACMWTMPAGTNAPLTQGGRTHTWIFRTLSHTSLQSSFFFFCSCQNLVDHICHLGYHMTRQILL